MGNTYDPDDSHLIWSVIIHALLIAGLYYLLTLQPQERPDSSPIQIDSITPKKSQERVAKRSKSVPVSQPQTHAKTSDSSHVSLSDLGMRFSYEPSVPQNAAKSAAETPADIPDDNGWDIMNPDPRVARFNQYIYNTVQGWLDRDAPQNPAHMTGSVKVRIWFDADGNYLENETVYDAIDPDFQKVVARALHKSFINPIPHPFLYIHKKFSIERVVVLREH